MRNIILLYSLFPLCLFAGTDYWQIQHNASEELHQHQALTVTMDVPQLKEVLLQAPLAQLKKSTLIHIDFPTPVLPSTTMWEPWLKLLTIARSISTC